VSVGEGLEEWAAREHQKARKGLRRRVTAWLGVNEEARRADALKGRVAQGVEGEKRTAALLRQLPDGWTVRYGRKLAGHRHDLDAVLASPCGTAVVVLDSKKWNARWPTCLRAGRVHCGSEDRHDQIEAVARYASRLHRALAMPTVTVWPLLVVHGSPVVGRVLAAQAPDWDGPVWVLSPPYLVPTLARAPKEVDFRRAAGVVARVDEVLVPYG